jgi:hypothetical protein
VSGGEFRRNLWRAAEHRALAATERRFAELLRGLGATAKAERHFLDAKLHEERAKAFHEAARRCAPRTGKKG